MSGELGGGQRLVAGRYRLMSELGRGGMGVVWRAHDEVLQREVAVKEVCAPANLEPAEVQRLYSRLEREGWAAARISHRGVVTVYDVATDDGRPWIVMELVRGLSFADVLDGEGRLEPVRAAAVGAEVVAALRAAHESGVLHRDVKPANILVANDGRVVLTDFGIAVIEGGSALTMTGELIGSPEYLAPERALGRTPGPASDLWSLGVTLYAAVEGYSPFRQDTPLSTMRAVVDDELPPPRHAGALGPVLDGLLRKDPERRLPADEAETMLRLVAAGGTPRTPTAVVPPGVPPGVPGYTPTVHAESGPPDGRAGAPTAPAGVPAGTGATAGYAAGAATTSVERRPRRSRLLVVAGLVVLLLGVGGVAWALLGGGGEESDGEGGSDAPADGGGMGSGGADGDRADRGAQDAAGGGGDESGEGGEGRNTGDESGGGGGGDDGGGGGGGGHAITVHVSVAAVRDSYTGSCPPAAGHAPYFTGTITVSGTPASVQYRWVTGTGEGGSDWKTLSFDGVAEQNVEHTVLAYAADTTYEDTIGIQVSSPQHAESDTVSFTTTCEPDEPDPAEPESESDPSYSADY